LTLKSVEKLHDLNGLFSLSVHRLFGYAYMLNLKTNLIY